MALHEGGTERSGLGVEVDQAKLIRFYESHGKRGEFPTYAGNVTVAAQ